MTRGCRSHRPAAPVQCATARPPRAGVDEGHWPLGVARAELAPLVVSDGVRCFCLLCRLPCCDPAQAVLKQRAVSDCDLGCVCLSGVPGPGELSRNVGGRWAALVLLWWRWGGVSFPWRVRSPHCSCPCSCRACGVACALFVLFHLGVSVLRGREACGALSCPVVVRVCLPSGPGGGGLSAVKRQAWAPLGQGGGLPSQGGPGAAELLGGPEPRQPLSRQGWVGGWAVEQPRDLQRACQNIS